MSNTFKKWQNREISDIDCIRELHSLVIGLHKKNTEFEKENEDLKKKLESKYNVL